ncbi:MAG TPA: 30S ribosomal protein THX [Bacteroidota bacterium]
MGRGDRRSRKSKIVRGTHGKTRPSNRKRRTLRRLQRQAAQSKA